MRLLAIIAVGFGCGGKSAAPQTPTPEPAPEVAGEPAPDNADAELYSCAKLRSSGQVSINIRAGYTPADVAAWLTAWSCRKVVVPSFLRGRSATDGFARLVTAAELDRVLVELLEPLEIAPVTQGAVTVFVHRDARLSDGKPGVVWQPTEPAPEDVTTEIDAGITRVDDVTYEIRRELVDAMLREPTKLARGARIVPSIQNGKPNGFKLYAIRPSSLYAKIGLMNGDTLNRINGQELSTPDKALEVYTQIRNASVVTVDLTRRGKPVTMTYKIID